MDWMPGEHRDPDDHYESSKPFDFDSIMLYDSYALAKAGSKVITRKDGGDIWSGGHPDPEYGRPSAGDVARIIMLYPKPDAPSQAEARAVFGDSSDEDNNNSPWKPWKPVKVVIPGEITTTVSPPPPFGSEDVAKAKKDNFGCHGCWDKVTKYNDIYWKEESQPNENESGQKSRRSVEAPTPMEADNATEDHDHDHLKSKRFYSLNTEAPDNDAMLTSGLWPEICPGTDHWLRYCFEDRYTMDLLLPILSRAITLWAPAFQVSSFRMQPDYACDGNYACLCDHVSDRGTPVARYSLVIKASNDRVSATSFSI